MRISVLLCEVNGRSRRRRARIHRALPLSVIALFLPFAALIALVVIFPRLSTSTSSARPIAEAVGVMVLAIAGFYGIVLVLSWVAPRV